MSEEAPLVPWKPCPWCQGPPELEEDRFLNWIGGISWRIKCTVCGATCGKDAGWRETTDAAVLAWNHRVEPGLGVTYYPVKDIKKP